jgi:hypothetical protein
VASETRHARGLCVLLLFVWIWLFVVRSLFRVVCSVFLALLFGNFWSDVGTPGRGWRTDSALWRRSLGTASVQCKGNVKLLKFVLLFVLKIVLVILFLKQRLDLFSEQKQFVA